MDIFKEKSLFCLVCTVMMVIKKCLSSPSLTEVDWILKSPCNLCSHIYKCLAEFTSHTKLEVAPISTSVFASIGDDYV